MIVIDVRTEQEFGMQALEGAINLPLAGLAQTIGHSVPDLDTPIALYCASGARSGAALGLLMSMGYRRVQNAGGLLMAAHQLQRPLR